MHASLSMSRPYYEWASKCILKKNSRADVPPYEDMVRGAIVGIAEVIDCRKTSKSKWHERGHYGFILANPRPVPTPIQCDGWLNFWEVPGNVARNLRKQILP